VVKKFIRDIKGRCDNLSLSLLLFVLLWSGLIFVPTSASLRDSRMENLAYAMFMAMGFYIFKSVSKTLGALIIYIGIISISTFMYELESFCIIITVIMAYIGIVYTYKEWRDRKNAIYDSIMIIAIANVIFQCFQYFHIYFVSYPAPGAEMFYCGLMNNVNDVSALYAICLPAFLRKNRWYYLPILFLGLYLSVTLNGVLASFLVLVLFAVLTIKKTKEVSRWQTGFICGVIAFSLLAFYMVKIEKFDLSSQKRGRLYIWSQTLNVASIKSTGWGIGQFDKVMPLITSYKYLDEGTRQYLYALVYDKQSFEKALKKVSGDQLSYFQSDKQSPTWFLQAHNEYIEMYFIGGVLGLLLALCFLLRHLWIAFKQKDRLPFYGLLSACLTAIFFFTWHIIPIVAITVVYLGLIRGEKRFITEQDRSLYDHGW
jgi:O-antigen ligase